MNVQQIGPVRFTTEITSIYHSYDATLSSINTFSAARGPSSGTWKDHARENTLTELFFCSFLNVLRLEMRLLKVVKFALYCYSKTNLNDRNFREINVEHTLKDILITTS